MLQRRLAMADRSMTLQLAFAAILLFILCGGGGSTCSALRFAYQSFDAASEADFSFTPGATVSNRSLQITPDAGDMTHRSGRVMYARDTLKLWKNSDRTALTSFKTEFVLNIVPRNGTGEGMAFILTNNPALPSDSSGRWLGLTNNRTDGAPANRIVALEFDTRRSFDADLDGNHVGLDLNSVRSLGQMPLSNFSIVLSRGADVDVTFEYDGKMMSVLVVQGGLAFTYAWYTDLSRYLLDNISVGFAASTGEFAQLNQVKSWNFTTVDDAVARGDGGYRLRRQKVFLAVLVPLTVGVLLMALLVWRRLTRQTRLAYRNLEKMIDAHGPVRFKLRELRNATGDFSDGRKLGRGGSGTVYLGYLRRMSMEVAVKRVSTNVNSNRGEKEFVAEVNTISKLSHRNLVKLIGWCHKKSELLLVYEYFPMGSLDKLLYARERTASSTSSMSASTDTPELTWERRYKIIRGVASALDYLHHGSSRRILHRDVKASNVMLDEEYNARLGDFGLARVIQHDGATHHSTQVVAGTRGYMAYESFFTGRASLDTDVYAFGVFVMEVVSGRSPSNAVQYEYVHDSDHRGGGEEEYWRGGRGRHATPMHIVDWMWRLYGEGKALHAAAPLLGGEFEQAQVDCAVRLALACCHPNPRERPSMRAAVQVLIDGAPAPEPPLNKPAFVWPPGGNRQEMELPDVGLLFTGDAGQHSSFCSMSCSISGR
ncbi:probable L-type lectin-domain containing receptor kinase S.5 [Triticum urartu]|nr:probable L-type lectin-domain containing receptor kinase S.5 [Triticum urartu]